MLAATIEGVTKYMPISELDVLPDNNTPAIYDYDNIPAEDTATITVYTPDCFFIPLHIKSLVPDEWCEDKKKS
eukprot:15367042-Ditylum_brightwellii.AAC.3